MKILPLHFYLNKDVIDVGQKLLGKYLFTKIDGVLTGGMITETESYKGIEDKACHAYMGKKTIYIKRAKFVAHVKPVDLLLASRLL